MVSFLSTQEEDPVTVEYPLVKGVTLSITSPHLVLLLLFLFCITVAGRMAVPERINFGKIFKVVGRRCNFYEWNIVMKHLP